MNRDKKDNQALTTTGESAVSVVMNNGLGDLLKPMIREIHLFDTYIAGTTHLDDESVLETVKVGDELILQRENNPFDKKAILVLNSEKKKLGYVPEKDNIVFSRLMDAGKILKAKISKINPSEWYTRISISIFLVDL